MICVGKIMYDAWLLKVRLLIGAASGLVRVKMVLVHNGMFRGVVLVEGNVVRGVRSAIRNRPISLFRLRAIGVSNVHRDRHLPIRRRCVLTQFD